MEIDINLSVLFHAIFYISIEIKSGAAGLHCTPLHGPILSDVQFCCPFKRLYSAH